MFKAINVLTTKILICQKKIALIESPYLSALDFQGVVRFAIAEVTKEGNPFVL